MVKMKGWKSQTDANSNKSWNNKCSNRDCPDYITNWRVGNCYLGLNFRSCPKAIKYKKRFS